MPYHHMGLTCTDALAVEAFYVKHFGFRRTRTVVLAPDKQIVFIRAGDVYLELFQSGEPAPPRPSADGPAHPGWRHIAFQVDDVDAALAALGDDATITLGPLSFDAFLAGWRAVWIADPEGNIIELAQGYVDEDATPSA